MFCSQNKKVVSASSGNKSTYKIYLVFFNYLNEIEYNAESKVVPIALVQEVYVLLYFSSYQAVHQHPVCKKVVGGGDILSINIYCQMQHHKHHHVAEGTLK